MTSEEQIQKVTERIIAALENGSAPWRKPWLAKRPMNLFSQVPYRGINFMNLLLAERSTPYWATFKQVKEHGGHVRKGEHGEMIVFWKTMVSHSRELQPDGSATDSEKTFPMLRVYWVFNLDQVEGIAPPETGTAPEPVAAAEALLAASSPHRAPIRFGGSRAYYSPRLDEIVLPVRGDFTSSEGFYETAFHESVHSTGHAARLNREEIAETHLFGDGVYSREELVAEIGSCLLCAEAGIGRETLDNAAAYCRSWLQALENNRTWIFWAANRAQKAVDYLTGRDAPTEAPAE